jgi:ABC-type nitrate/sulfonate/bicarbonate transport system substrate-binding protein
MRAPPTSSAWERGRLTRPAGEAHLDAVGTPAWERGRLARPAGAACTGDAARPAALSGRQSSSPTRLIASARPARPVNRFLALGLAALTLLAACAPASSPSQPASKAAAPAAPPASSGAPAAASPAPAAIAAPTAAAPPVRARIAYSSTSPAFLAHFVAEGLGLYQQYGLESESLAASPAVSIPGLTTGEIDYVLSIGSLLRAAAKGVPVRALAVHLPKPNFFLITEPNVREAADLRGKVLGVTGYGGNSHVTTQLYVAALGLDPQHDVQYLNLGEENVLWESIKLGRIDGAPLTPPYPALAEREGMHVLGRPDDLTLEYPFTGVGTSVDKIATHRDDVKRMLKAQLAALQAIQTEREAVVRIMADRFAVEPDVAALTWDQIHTSWSRDGSISREGVETLQRLDVEAGALDAIAPFEQLADPSVLAEVHRELGR